MQFYCNQFTYGDITLPTKEMATNCRYICFASFDGGVDEDIENAYNLEIEKMRTGNNPQYKIINSKYADVLTFDIVLICTDDAGVTLKEERDIVRAFGEYINNYRRLTIIDDEDENYGGRMHWKRYEDLYRIEDVHYLNFNSTGENGEIYFNAICNNIYTLKKGNKIRGFKFTFECDSPYAWQDYTYHIDATTYETAPRFTVDTNTDDRWSLIYPKIVAHKKVLGDDSYHQNIYPDYDNFDTVTNDNIYTQKSVRVKGVYITGGGQVGSNCLRIVSANDETVRDITHAAYVKLGSVNNNYGCVNVVPGGSYCVSFFTKSEKSTNADVDMIVYCRTENNKDIDEETVVKSIGTFTAEPDTYRRYFLRVDVPDNCSYMSLRLGVDSPDADVAFDGIMIERVYPYEIEPSNYSDNIESTSILNIFNEQTRRVMRVNHVEEDEFITIDCKNSYIVSDILNKNMYNEFNKYFMYFDPHYEKNTLAIRFFGDVEITYSLPRKVGT